VTHEHWKIIADAFDPTVALLAIAAPWIFTPAQSRSRPRYFIATAAALALMYLLRAVEHSHLAMLPRLLGVHYSAHTGFAVVFLTAMGIWRRWLVWPGIAALAAYGELMVYQAYHTWGDIGATAVVILSTTLCVFRFAQAWRFSASQEQTLAKAPSHSEARSP